MKKYIVIYHAPADAWQQTADVSKEDMAKGMEEWMIWAKNCGNSLLDMGSPLMNGQELIPNGQSRDSKRNVMGYSFLQAENIEEAKALLQGHPHLKWKAECSIEVHEAMPLPGM